VQTAVDARRTEQRIVEAATTLFYEKGFHGTSMREIAAAVGIKAGSLYNHYAGKEDLLVRIATGTMEELLEGGRQAVAGQESPRDQLHALLMWHVVYHARGRFKARVADEQLTALSAVRREPVLRVRDAYTQLFKDILTQGQEVEGWHIPSVPVITFGIGGMCTFVDTWYRTDGPLSPEQIAEIYADFVLRGLERRDA
jgi:AcrR family transcriptional regulator